MKGSSISTDGRKKHVLGDVHRQRPGAAEHSRAVESEHFRDMQRGLHQNPDLSFPCRKTMNAWVTDKAEVKALIKEKVRGQPIALTGDGQIRGVQQMGGLTGVSWTLLVVHSIWSCALGLDMHKFWRMRKKMRIFARWPALALLSGCAGGVVQACIVLQEVLAQEGHVLPCVVVLYLHPVAIGPDASSYLLRGLRAVIISDKAWRMKYMALFSRNSIAIFFTSLVIVLLGICAMLQQVASDVYGVNSTEVCVFSWRLVVLVPFMLPGDTGGLEALHRAFTSGRQHQHGQGNFHDSWGVGCFSWFMIELWRHRGEVSCWKKKRKKQKVFIDDANVAAWTESWHNSAAIMSHPILDRAFEKHVQDYLCFESYDFVKEIGDREAFMSAATERRRDVFNPPKAEVLKILDDNLLQSFLASQQFLDASKNWQEALAADASTSSKSNTLGTIDNRDAFNGSSQAYTTLQEMYHAQCSGRGIGANDRGPSQSTRTSITGTIKGWTSHPTDNSRTEVFALTESFSSTVLSE